MTLTNLIFFSQSAELFEGPIFDTEHQLLYFVSILDGLVYCYNPVNKEILSIYLDSPASNVYLISKKKVLVATKNGFYQLDFHTLSSSFRFQIEIDKSVRYNDGIEDAEGRIIIGTMGYPNVVDGLGKVYSFHKGKSMVIIDNTTISNGLAFSKDSETLYFIDTPTKKVAKYRYDLKTGVADFLGYVIEFNGDGSPDGMCMDKDGMLWIAEWGGSCVSHWNPLTGKQIGKINLPFKNITSCCIDHLDNLYITSAKSDKESDYTNGSSLFYVELSKTQRQ